VIEQSETSPSAINYRDPRHHPEVARFISQSFIGGLPRSSRASCAHVVVYLVTFAMVISSPVIDLLAPNQRQKNLPMRSSYQSILFSAVARRHFLLIPGELPADSRRLGLPALDGLPLLMQVP
jgi:hypothetical protein